MYTDSFSDLFYGDVARYGGTLRCHEYVWRLLYYFRKSQTNKNRVLQYYYRIRYRVIRQQHGVEIPWQTRIGKGLYLGHVYNITVNGETVIGDNCNLHKGVTIGQTNRGNRKGTPVIGNNVWIGVNATIVGNIKVGDDVLIAPNAYVNCDIPSHSVVIGNPCLIRPKEQATESYINNRA